jgi:hypothetical protein
MPLLQKVADKAFITRTAFDQYLLETYNKTIEQQNNSKSKIINDVKQQLEAYYASNYRTSMKLSKAKKNLAQES